MLPKVGRQKGSKSWDGIGGGGWDWIGVGAKRVKPLAPSIKTVQWMDYPLRLCDLLSCPAQKFASNGFGFGQKER